MLDYDVVIVGGGHAGVEASLAVARMGKRAAIVTMDASKLALMSCNPAIGGIGKSHLVKEIDAMGGVMGQAIDVTGIQFRRLNLSRGPAVWSTRVQADRIKYNQYIVDYVNKQKNIDVIEGIAGKILKTGGKVSGIRLESEQLVNSQAVIIATGTFLSGLIYIGDKTIKAGRIGEKAAYKLSDCFRDLGFELGRLKTGTPPRLNGDTIDWSQCEVQKGEEPIPFFSFHSQRKPFEQVPCHLTYTSAETKEIISANFKASPIFSGQISSRGPRYCPSIEDKFYRFADKEKHQIFLEPEGNGTNEIYPNGFSTALPEDIQHQAIKTVIGLNEVKITRPGYAIEYDYAPTYQIKPSLETKHLRGLFLAGQINGTSGYEEAAAQGLMAGINAILYIEKEPPFILDRSEAYIGVMIDDLTTHTITEPYRLFTSRAEYRLTLREDNARDRLYKYGKKYNLISSTDYDSFYQLQRETEKEIKLWQKKRIDVNSLGVLGERFKKRNNISLAELLKQPGVTIKNIMPVLAKFNGEISDNNDVLERVAIIIRYQGYIEKQQREIEKFRKMEQEVIPDNFQYDTIKGLKNEALEKLRRFRPGSLGQAGRLEGVTPGDVAVLSVYLKKNRVAQQ